MQEVFHNVIFIQRRMKFPTTTNATKSLNIQVSAYNVVQHQNKYQHYTKTNMIIVIIQVI